MGEKWGATGTVETRGKEKGTHLQDPSRVTVTDSTRPSFPTVSLQTPASAPLGVGSSFEAFDSNGDGVIDRAEWALAGGYVTNPLEVMSNKPVGGDV